MSARRKPLDGSLTTRSVWACAVAVVGIGILVFGMALVLGLVVSAIREQVGALIVVAVLLQSTATLMALTLILRRAGHTFASLGFSRPKPRLLHLLWQIPAAFVVILSVQGIVFAATDDDPSGGGSAIDGIGETAGPVLALGLFISVAVITPIWEELFFRGVIHGAARQRLGKVGATLVSATVFALVHGVPILLPYMTALGLCLALLREFHANLWGPLALHVTLNTVASSTLLFAVLN